MLVIKPTEGATDPLNRTFEVLKEVYPQHARKRGDPLNRTFEVLKVKDEQVVIVDVQALNRTFEVLKVSQDSAPGFVIGVDEIGFVEVA